MSLQSTFLKLAVLVSLALAGTHAVAEVITLKVTASGGRYFIDDLRTPVIEVAVGDTLFFDLSDRSLNAHPFYITEVSDSGQAFAGAIAADTGRGLMLAITEETPVELFYSCTRHRRMGGDGLIVVVE